MPGLPGGKSPLRIHSHPPYSGPVYDFFLARVIPSAMGIRLMSTRSS